MMSRCLLKFFYSIPLLTLVGCSTTQAINPITENSNPSKEITYPPDSVVWYAIKRGDNLPLIASEVTGSTQNWQRIASFNNIENPASIKVGQRIYIPKHMLPTEPKNTQPLSAAALPTEKKEITSTEKNTSLLVPESRGNNQTSPIKPKTYITKYTCSELSSKSAYSLLASGHSYLDRDGDGHPCEWGKTRAKKTYSGGGKKCHTVRGYRRKNGTYVRGHTRCR